MMPYVSAPYGYYYAFDSRQYQMTTTSQMQEMYQMYGQNFISNVDASQLQLILTDKMEMRFFRR